MRLICMCFLVLGVLIVGTNGLQCYKCVNTEVKSGSSLLKKLFDGKTDPECSNPSLLDQASSGACEDASQVCGLVESTVKASVPFMGDITFKLQARDCMDPPETISGPKCYDDNDEVIGFVKGILNVLLALTLGDLSVDGRVCFCNTDLCAAGGCGDGKVGILGYCLEWYYWALLGLAAIVGVLVLTCCCCCCCRCCRSQKPRGGVIQMTPAPQAVVVTTGNGIAGIENPGYTQAYAPVINK